MSDNGEIIYLNDHFGRSKRSYTVTLSFYSEKLQIGIWFTMPGRNCCVPKLYCIWVYPETWDPAVLFGYLWLIFSGV